MTAVQATYAFEIEVDLTGKYMPGYKGDQIDPPEGDIIEDAEIVGFGIVNYVPPKGPALGALYATMGKHVTKSLIDGVNAQSPDVQRLLANMLAAIRDEANEALIEAASE